MLSLISVGGVTGMVKKTFKTYKNMLGTSCLDTQEEIPFGLHIDQTHNWATQDDIDCSAPAVSNALNSALTRFTKNISLK